jgi:hypothetical protein
MLLPSHITDKVDELSFWPQTEPIDNTDIGLPHLDNCADWRLDLCRDGTLSLRTRRQKPFNGAAIAVYQHDDKAMLEDVQTLMCSLGYTRDPRLVHEDGRRYIWSWFTLPGTLWQVGAVQRVIHLYVSTGSGQKAVDEAVRLNRIVRTAADLIESR